MGLDIFGSKFGGTAMYLRCYPYDSWQMRAHRHALHDYTERLGLPESCVYLDNGCRSGGPSPELERLIGLVAQGIYRTVLIPGAFVFSLDDTEARAVTRRIGAGGCRIVELPSPHSVVGSR